MTSGNYIIQDHSTAPIILPAISPALCGQNNGSINLSVTPDTGNTFLWSNSATDEDLQNIGPGIYAVTCTGVNGCIAIDTIDLPNSNTNFSLTATPTPNTSCAIANGGIDVTITPTGAYQFLWSNGATSEDLQNLSAGDYSVTITDANGCSDAQMFSIGGPVLPQVAIGAPALVCEGDTVILSANPGFLTYLWSSGQTTESIPISQAGTYAVTVADANGCAATASQVFANLPLPAPVIGGPAFICGGNAANAVFSVPNTFPQILWSTGATTPTISVSQTGTYLVTVTDANGCTASDSIALTVSPPFSPDIITAPTNCDGTATLDAGSGYATYIWSNGSTGQQVTVNSAGNYTVTVSDANGCMGTASENVTLPTPPQVAITGLNFICPGSNAVFSVPNTFAQILWSTGAATPSISVSQTGTYLVTVTDANGCTATDAITLTVSPPFSPEITTAPTNCDGTATLDAGSGYAAYLWSNGATGQQILVNTNGTYAVTVSDANGCPGTSAEIVTIPALPQVQIAGSANLCEGDETVLAAPGNFAQYLWSTGATTPEITIIQGGVYSVTVTDMYGCAATDVFTVTQLQSDYTLVEAASCSVQDTGLVETLLSNQFGCDSLVVTNTVLSLPVLTQIQLNACPGESVVFNGVSIVAGGSTLFGYTAANGCDSIVQVTVGVFPAVNFTATTTETCWNMEDGNILVAMLSGVPPYHYALNGGPLQPESTFADLPGGEYAIEVVDANGCEYAQIVEVLQTTPTQVLVEDATLSCETGTTTLRPVVAAGEPETLVWQWPDGSDKPWLQVTEPGRYEVLIDDGCEMIARSIEVVWEEIARKKELFYVPNGFSPNDDGINDEFRVFFGEDFEVLSFEFRVFDRWGDAMFMTTKMDGAWDGVYRGIEMQPAVYAWFVKAKVQLCGGRVVDVFRKGDVTIVR